MKIIHLCEFLGGKEIYQSSHQHCGKWIPWHEGLCTTCGAKHLHNYLLFDLCTFT